MGLRRDARWRACVRNLLRQANQKELSMAKAVSVTYYGLFPIKGRGQIGLMRMISTSEPLKTVYENVDYLGDWVRDHDLVDYVLGITSGFGEPGAEEITELEAEAWYREHVRAPM